MGMKWVASLVPLLWGFTVFGQINSWYSWSGGDWHDLGASQVSQIQFENPAGLLGSFPARILPDGEVVPAPTRIVMERHTTEPRLFWPDGFILQTSTNVSGPFEDLANTLSGLPVPLVDPARFFRIRPRGEAYR